MLPRESAPFTPTLGRMQRFRNALDRSRGGLDKSRNGLDRSKSGLSRSHNGLDRSRNGGNDSRYSGRSKSGLSRSINGLSKSISGMSRSRNGMNRSRTGLDGEVEEQRVKRFGMNKRMWEEKGLQNTPEGVTPEKLTLRKSKPITKEDDRLPPSAHCSSPCAPGSDIITRKGFVGNVSLLKGQIRGESPNEEIRRLSDFPNGITTEIVEKLLEKQKEIRGKPYPDCVAFTIWATDNMNTYGKSMAQIFSLLGVRLIKDTVDELELIPLAELKRPRIDVIVNCSGVFRDLFQNQMSLIDKAIKMTAQADETPDVNLIRKHSFQMTQELGNMTLREAATRVFSNAAGSYSSNIAAWVKSGEWESEFQLQRQFLARKCYAFNSDKPGIMEYKSELFRSVLRSCEMTVQNLDLNGILSITDVPHYYDSDPTKVIEALRFDNRRPICLLAKTMKEGIEVHTLSDTIRLDSMSKILSPEYYEKILKENDDGVRKISNCMRNILGWSITSGEVDTFIFEIAHGLFLEDGKMSQRLRLKDNKSFGHLVSTFVKAGEQHYWETSESKIRRLRELKKYAESEM